MSSISLETSVAAVIETDTDPSPEYGSQVDGAVSAAAAFIDAVPEPGGNAPELPQADDLALKLGRLVESISAVEGLSRRGRELAVSDR